MGCLFRVFYYNAIVRYSIQKAKTALLFVFVFEKTLLFI